MKPGSIKSDAKGPGQVLHDRTTQTDQVGRVERGQPQADQPPQIPEGRSQLPEGPSSTADRREAQVLNAQAEARKAQAKRTGKRQKFLKVPTVKTLSKQARLAFKALADLLGKAKEVLERFRRKTMDDDDGEQQRRRQHEDGFPEAEEPKVDPSKVPRGLKPLPH